MTTSVGRYKTQFKSNLLQTITHDSVADETFCWNSPNDFSAWAIKPWNIDWNNLCLSKKLVKVYHGNRYT